MKRKRPRCSKPDCDRTPHPGLACNEHAPRHQYDCSRCKFSWCCGILCACFTNIGPPPPPARRRYVERRQREWRIANGYEKVGHG